MIHKGLRKCYKKQFGELQELLNRMHYKMDDDFIHEEFINTLCFIAEEQGYKSINFNAPSKVLALSYIVLLYSDLYKRLNYLKKLDLLDEDEEELYLDIINIRDLDDLIEVLREYYIHFAMEIMRFDDLAVYDKVLQIKYLSEEDVSNIARINPFFMEEYNAYNVLVNEEFMLRQIVKWQRIFDEKRSYEDASNFIKKYSIIDSSLQHKLEDRYPENTLTATIKRFYLSERR